MSGVRLSSFVPPLGLRVPLVRRWGVPLADRSVLLGEVPGDAVAAARVLVGRHAAERAELEEVPVAQYRHGPGEGAVDDEEGRARSEPLLQEPFQHRTEPQPLEPEVHETHEHRPVLARVVHMAQGEVGVGLHHLPAELPARCQCRAGLVGVEPGPYRYQVGLGQDGSVQGGREVNGGPAAGSDEGRGYGPGPY